MSDPVTMRDDTKPYFFVVSGHDPLLSTWDGLKDELKKVIPGNPGFVFTQEGRVPGEKRATCPLKNKAYADAAYDYFSSKQLEFHILERSSQTDPYHLYRCSSTGLDECTGKGGIHDNQSGVDAGVSTAHYSVPTQPTQPAYQGPSYYSTQPYASASTYSYPGQPTQPAYQDPSYYPTQPYASASTYSYPGQPTQPGYLQSSGGLPVNLSQSVASPETHGILIEGLSDSVEGKDLKYLFYIYRLYPLQYSLHKDPQDASKGVGRARFPSREEAKYAASELNGKQFMERTLIVRMDTDSTVNKSVPRPPPSADDTDTWRPPIAYGSGTNKSVPRPPPSADDTDTWRPAIADGSGTNKSAYNARK